MRGYIERLGTTTIIDKKNPVYLDLTVLLIQRYIEGHPIRNLSKKFYKENLSVKATACELLEMVLNKLENDKNRARLSIH